MAGPSQYDLLNLQTAAVMRDPLGPLAAAGRLRQQEERDDRRTHSLLEARLRFEEAQDQRRYKFQAEQGRLDRQSRIEQSEASAKATLDRMSQLDKQRVRERLILETGIKPGKDEEIDDYILRASQEKDQRALGTLKSFDAQEKKVRDEMKALETSELGRQSKSRKELVDALFSSSFEITEKEKSAIAGVRAKASKNKLGELSYRAALEAAQIPAARKAEIAGRLSAIEAAAEQEVAKVPREVLQEADDLRGRLLGLDRSRSTFSASDDGQRALSLYYRDQPQAATEAAAKAVMDRSPAASEAEYLRRPVSEPGDGLGQDFREPQADAPRALPAPTRPASGIGLPPGFSGVVKPMIPPIANALRGGFEGLQRMTGNRPPGVDQRVTQLFGEDAPALLNEASKLSESNGIPPEQQQATFNAALSGDVAAQEQISSVLNYLRQAKRTQAGQSFQPSFDPGSLFPTNTIDTLPSGPAYPGPSFAPVR